MPVLDIKITALEVVHLISDDVSWLYYHNVNIKSESKLCVSLDEEVPLGDKKYKSVDERMDVMFFAKGKVSHSPFNLWLFHHDNTCVHQDATTREFLGKTDLKLLKYPAYRACDFSLFSCIKLKMKGGRFSLHEELVATFEEERDFVRT